MNGLEITVAPAAYPVSLAEAKARLRIDAGDDDADLQGLIAAATAQVEAFLGKSLISRTYRAWWDEWPTSAVNAGALELPRPPLVSVTSVKTYDDDDVATTMDTGDYLVDATSTAGRVVLRTGATWPTVTRAANGIEVVYVAGYGAQLPPALEDVRLALLAQIGWLNEHRGDDGEIGGPLSPAARALLAPHILWRL